MPRNIDMTFYNTATWGCELEGTFATRCQCARVIAKYFNTSYQHEVGSYDKYLINTSYGVWTVMRDSSVTPLKKRNGVAVSASDEYRVEIVTPPLVGAPAIPMFQEVVRALRKQVGFAPCVTAGCHIHIGLQSLPEQKKPLTIINVFNELHSKQDLLLDSLGITTASVRYGYCRKIPTALVKEFQSVKRSKKDNLKLSDVADAYYSVLGDRRQMYTRYPSARYFICNATRCLLPDSRYFLNTIEFRVFNSTNHAGQLKSYIQFCLLLVQYASSISKSSYKVTEVREGESRCYKWRCFLLKLNVIGDEFKTMRHFFLDKFGNESRAWRRGDSL